MKVILVPGSFDLKPVLDFINKIQQLPNDEEYCFDFSHLRWVTPFGMLMISQTLKGLRESNYSITYRNLNKHDATHYASYMGFFHSCGFEIGNDTKSKSERYIPLTYDKVNRLKSNNEIEELSAELSRLLILQNRGSLFDALNYSFREIIRNVIEHSRSDVFAYCAQYIPNQTRVELAILDTGIGIRKSLSRNPHLDIENDGDAIKYALMPGISGNTYEGIKIRKDDVWQNSGYGLYMNYRLCNEGGSFFIGSGSQGLYRTDGEPNTYYDINYQGTILRLVMNSSNLRDISLTLERFRDDGQKIAHKLGKGAVLNASTMSIMLKNNFKIDNKIEVGSKIKHPQYGEGEVTEKLVTPQGEMLWVTFKGGRRKKVLSSDVTVIDIDFTTYSDENIEIYPDID